jgi:hypothetical protein
VGGGGCVRAFCVRALMPAASIERSAGRLAASDGGRAGVRAGVMAGGVMLVVVMVGAGVD